MKEGFTGKELILAIASCSVPRALGFAGLSKPTWLSEICRKVKAPLASSAPFASPMESELATPPLSAQSMPVPAQTMHSSAPLRFISGPPFFQCLFVMTSPSRLVSCRLFYPDHQWRLDGTALYSRTPSADWSRCRVRLHRGREFLSFWSFKLETAW